MRVVHSADAPWCVHCQRLLPVWHQLALLYAGSDDVIVAQIDVTANDVTGVEINVFPTIKLYGKDGHTVGPRSVNKAIVDRRLCPNAQPAMCMIDVLISVVEHNLVGIKSMQYSYGC